MWEYYSAFGWCNKLTVLIKTMHGVNSFKVKEVSLVLPLKIYFINYNAQNILELGECCRCRFVGCSLDNRGIVVQLLAWSRDSSLSQNVQTDPGSYLTSYPVGTSSIFVGIRRLGRDADHSPPCGAEVKNK
jgi:hypothetical protein